MDGAVVHSVLAAKDIDLLHHANSVTTSLAFLRLGGLASRQRVEASGFSQTNQYTDTIDKDLGIWNDIFTDNVDIHARIKSRNQYGPVLFSLEASILMALSTNVDVLVTKLNPSKWHSDQSIDDRYFTTLRELQIGLTKGTFDHIVTFRVADGLIPFGRYLCQVVLDDPKLKKSDGTNIFSAAKRALEEAAGVGRVTTPITRRECGEGCNCRRCYYENSALVRELFSVP